MPTLALIMAMQAEADPVIAGLGLVAQPPSAWAGPVRAWGGRRGTLDLVLLHAGTDPRFGVDAVGKVPASLAAYQAVRDHGATLLLSAGTAGGFRRRGGAIGDLVLGLRTVHHDRRIPLPGFDTYGVGDTPAPTAAATLAARLGFKTGTVSSGESLDFSDREGEALARLGADAKEMEAAAVAWVAELYRVPVLVLKAITDLVDHPEPTPDQFLRNLAQATRILADGVVRLVDHLAGDT